MVFPAKYSVSFSKVYMDRKRYDAIMGLLRARTSSCRAPGVSKTYAAQAPRVLDDGRQDASRVGVVGSTRATPARISSRVPPPVRGSRAGQGRSPSARRPPTTGERLLLHHRQNQLKIFGRLFMLIEAINAEVNSNTLLRELFPLPWRPLSA